MRKIALIIFCVLGVGLAGCSNANSPATPEVRPVSGDMASDTNHWNWGIWQFRFSADHSSVEAIPQREGNYHYCVTKFVEGFPCPHCLMIGKPHVQGDGTVKLKVALSHPFPTMPIYTGFDVRGMVYFPPTSYHEVPGFLVNGSRLVEYGFDEHMFPTPYGTMPLSYSRAAEGGGELLNADGYSTYMIPGILYADDWPIFSYQPGKHGKEPTPQLTTVNPYKLFASDTERRMFLVTDLITREYHLALPPGEFCFGYAVDASWCPPAKTPVTDPAIDFPLQANAEDPWQIDYEQLLPIYVWDESSVDKDIFKVTVHERGTFKYQWWFAYIWCWDCSISPFFLDNPEQWLFAWQVLDVVDPFTTTENYNLDIWNWGYYFSYGWGVPGHHLGVLVVSRPTDYDTDPPCELGMIYGVKLIDIYIE